MTLLLLAGTAEARALAARLVARPGVALLTSLAGATRAPKPYPGRLRVGGFGGAEGFARVLRAEGVRAVVDATHPFARVMPGRAQAICAARGLPYLRLLRPAWAPAPGERWCELPDEAAVAGAVPPGARVFLATGARSLARFGALAEGRYLIVRRVEPTPEPFPFARGSWWVGRPPFTYAAELQSLRDSGAEVLVAKNAGGPTRAKLDAARALGLPVVMIARPAPPPGDRVATVAAAEAWVAGLTGGEVVR